KDKKYDYYPRHERLPPGWEMVRGCGGFTLYPRWVWENQGYGVPEPFPEAGNEVNYLCQCPGILTYVTFNVKALRETPKEIANRSMINRVRTTVKLRTRLRMKRSPPLNGLIAVRKPETKAGLDGRGSLSPSQFRS